MVLPRVSTAGRRRMMARRLAMRDTPMASVTVMAAGRPSGIAPTASATAAISMSRSGSPRRLPTTKPSTASPRMITSSQLENRSMALVSGVARVSVASSRSAMRPVSVPRPVDTTRPPACPATTRVPAKAMQVRSAMPLSAATGSTPLETAVDSPVNEASVTCSARASKRRRSAGTLSPAASHTTSPGTSVTASMRRRWPARSTVTSLATLRASAASASSARPS